MSNIAPLRSTQERVKFCDAYFKAVGAPILFQSDNYREYELPQEVDKALTDRPYYWMWVETTQQKIPPNVLRLAFTEEALSRENERLREVALRAAEKQNFNHIERMFFRSPKAELIDLGSFRLQKLFDSVAQLGRFASVCPVATQTDDFLIPWLLVHAKITYRCDISLQKTITYGLCFHNNQIVSDFYEKISRIRMKAISVEHLKLTPSSISNGIKSLTSTISKTQEDIDHVWALDAQTRLEKDIDQLRTYYQSLLLNVTSENQSMMENEMNKKIQERKDKSQPLIHIDIAQIALVGLPEPHHA